MLMDVRRWLFYRRNACCCLMFHVNGLRICRLVLFVHPPAVIPAILHAVATRRAVTGAIVLGMHLTQRGLQYCCQT